MRIISGKYKGSILKGHDINGTRPTMDRVKESMFAVIQTNIKGSCLDLFAGSGSLGIEALSNGCSECYFVDNNKIATDVIKENVNKLKLKESVFVLNLNYKKALEKFKKENTTFELVLLDPPYQKHLINDVLESLYDLVNKDGIVVLEYESEEILDSKFSVIKTKKYGSKYVTFMRK